MWPQFPESKELPDIVRDLWERTSALDRQLGNYMGQTTRTFTTAQQDLSEQVAQVDEKVVKVAIGGLRLQAWGLILVTFGAALGAVPALAQVSSPSAAAVAHTSPVSHATRHAIAHASGSIWTTDVPGWVASASTGILAIFAIVAAYYARKAFRKQSQEVRAIEQQVLDQQEIARQQAELIRIQSEQLAEQRIFNEEQLRVLALQAEELRESLAERKREAVERRNAQASQVHLALKVVARSREGGPEIEATVVNTSERQQPVYDGKLYWHLGPDSYGTPNPELLGTLLTSRDESRRREFPRGADPAACGAALSFRDAFGVNWVKTPDGGAMHADSELLPDFVEALSGTSRNGDSPPYMVPDVG